MGDRRQWGRGASLGVTSNNFHENLGNLKKLENLKNLEHFENCMSLVWVVPWHELSPGISCPSMSCPAVWVVSGISCPGMSCPDMSCPGTSCPDTHLSFWVLC